MVKAEGSNSLQFTNFTVVYQPENNYGTTYWGFSIAGEVLNYDDQQADGEIPGLNDNGHQFDIIAITAGGVKYSILGDEITYIITSEGMHDVLRFGFSSGPDISPETIPVGTMVAELRVHDTVSVEWPVIDTVSVEWPYLDGNGKPILPLKSPPQLVYPQAGNTILDTNPRFCWLNPPGIYDADSVSFNFGVWFLEGGSDYYLWAFEGLSNPPLGMITVTFPKAPEYPTVPIREIMPHGKSFPSELPVGLIGYQLVAYEWFTFEENPVCHFYTAYSTINQFTVGGKPVIFIAPEVWNLASNVKWITGYIELPEGYSVNEIDASSIRVNGIVPIDASYTPKVGDYDSDGIADLTVKFSRAALNSLLSNAVDMSPEIGKYSIVELTISGTVGQTPFADICTIKVRK